MEVADVKPEIVEVTVQGVEFKIPIEVWGRPHTFDETSKECIWDLGDPHEGKRFEAKMFKRSNISPITIPICVNHLSGHRIIMSMHKQGMDINDIIDMGTKEREYFSRNIVLATWDEI